VPSSQKISHSKNHFPSLALEVQCTKSSFSGDQGIVIFVAALGDMVSVLVSSVKCYTLLVVV